MKLFVKNKFMSLSGGSYVLDENENKVFVVKGKWGIFSPTRKKKVYDVEGNLLYIVRNKFWHFLKRTCFVYDADKEKVLDVSEKKFDFKNDFEIEGYQDEISFEGKLFQFPNINLEIIKNGKNIGKLTKQWNMWRDSYCVEIPNEEDAGLMVALTIAVDNVFDRRRDEK